MRKHTIVWQSAHFREWFITVPDAIFYRVVDEITALGGWGFEITSEIGRK